MEFKLDGTDVRTGVKRTGFDPKQSRNGGPLLEEYRKEMDGFFEIMEGFNKTDPSEIFRSIAAMSSRVSHIRSLIVRADSKVWMSFRTKEIDPFLTECDRQFKIWSRAFSVQTLDWEMTKGV